MDVNLDADTLLFTSLVALVTCHSALHAWRELNQPLTAVMALGVGAMGLRWLLDRQRSRDASRSNVEHGVRGLEERHARIASTHLTSPDGELYHLRNAEPSGARPLRHLRTRPHVANALTSLRDLGRRHWGQLRRVLVALEDFYARATLLARAKNAAAVARNLDTMMDTRAEALNMLATLAWVRPGQRHQARLSRVIHIVREDTLTVTKALADVHAPVSPDIRAKSPAAQGRQGPHGWDPSRDAMYHMW